MTSKLSLCGQLGVTPVVLVIVLTSVGIGCASETVESEPLQDAIHHLQSGDEDLVQQGACYVLKAGRKAVPALIESIEDNGAAMPALNDPYASTVGFPLEVMPAALASAYMVEVLVSGYTPSCEDLQTSFWLGSDPSHFPFRSGVIVSSDGNPVAADSLEGIRDAYRGWWGRSAKLDLEELRSEWRQGRRPLTGSGFSWR